MLYVLAATRWLIMHKTKNVCRLIDDDNITMVGRKLYNILYNSRPVQFNALKYIYYIGRRYKSKSVDNYSFSGTVF